MAETDPLIDDLPPLMPGLTPDAQGLANLMTRSGRQSDLIKTLRGQLDAEKLAHATTQGSYDAFKNKHEALKTTHATELEESETKRTTEVSRMERKQALTAAGVEAEGFDTVLAAYEAAGEDRPPIVEWLKGEELPKHVTTYMGGTEPERRGRPAPKRPDGGTGPVRIPGGRTRLSEMTSIEELKAAKERGDF